VGAAKHADEQLGVMMAAPIMRRRVRAGRLVIAGQCAV